MTNEDKEKLIELVNKHCKSIKKPYHIQEICLLINSGEYGAEFMLKHLLLWCNSQETKNEHLELKETETQYFPAYEASQIWLRLHEYASNTEYKSLSASERELYEALTKRYTREAKL